MTKDTVEVQGNNGMYHFTKPKFRFVSMIADILSHMHYKNTLEKINIKIIMIYTQPNDLNKNKIFPCS